MLVSDKPYEMVGFMSPIEDGPGFVVPLFTMRNSNMLLVQEISDDDTILNFRQVEPRNFQRLYGNNQFLALGDHALWGFHFGAAGPIIMERDLLRERLLSTLDDLKSPLLKLQVAQFCDDQGELIAAWRVAYEHLEKRAPLSAQAWRDVVVIPTQMRLAVESAIIANGLHASIKDLDRAVEVDVERGQLRLRLRPDLYSALTRHPAAMASLEHNAAPIREAFQLSANSVSLVPYQSESDAKFGDDETRVDDFAIAGFGAMAVSLIDQVYPRIKHSPDWRTSVWYGPPRGSSVRVLLQRDELSGRSVWQNESKLELSPQNTTLLVLCQLGPGHLGSLDDAINFASLHRDKRRKVIAVIPHLPTEFEEPGELAHSVMPHLHNAFDGVWALSDRSPYTRQSQAYGPGRSTQAAAANFRYLIRVAQDKRLCEDLLSGKRETSGINVIGSATGDKDVPKLIEHALKILRHHLFDLRTVTSTLVQATTGGKIYGRHTVHEIVHRYAPYADVTFSVTPKGDGGPDRVFVLLNDVALLPDGNEAFKQYCIGQLAEFDERVVALQLNSLVESGSGAFQASAIEFKYVAAGSFEARHKNRRRRRLVDDIVLTNAVIRRRTFATWVVNGAVLVHSSRIESLLSIYRRRYSYALTYFQNDVEAADRIIVPAAIEWLNLHPLFETKNIGRASIAPDTHTELDFGPSGIELSLALQFTKGRGASKSTTLGHADIVLDKKGWHLDRLNIADEWIHGA